MGDCDPELMGQCVQNALSLTGFNIDSYEACLVTVCHVSRSCADCLATEQDYAHSHCKAECLLGWCKQSCLDCTAPGRDAAANCSGWQPETPDPCLDSTNIQCT